MTHSRGPDRRAVLRGAALTTGATVLGGGALLGAAAPAAAAPSVHTRAAWGARPPSSPIQVLATPPLYIVVHHTATANSTDHSLAHAYSLSRAIQNHHMDTNGWADTGQQLTISRGGHVMEGRDRTLPAVSAGQHVVGAHVANNNSTCVGIENEGTYTSVAPTAPLRNSLVETLAWLCAAYRLNPRSAILGHRDFNATACPGDVLYAMLPELREAVAGLLAARGVRVTDRPVPAESRPTHPAVPDEPWREFDHGPGHGPDDITR